MAGKSKLSWSGRAERALGRKKTDGAKWRNKKRQTWNLPWPSPEPKPTVENEIRKRVEHQPNPSSNQSQPGDLLVFIVFKLLMGV